ncbi:MAG: phosphate/phosphite/phosphonate ABC transporter substrate-binding protein [Candidatus Thiodiazotropha weberae]|nr:phosphate/phosphite/phosphonate ABC transporter substrate-binding protein [Candidatus Thiodiazotropha lotti]MCG7989494.1 phosphate/phosphite/phosphonate ABC transporter substrate-binding protein [Candidatus Thiodiazotropha lotti]MCG8011101.1 phosphate/phosphite/phosphonate ABC transporter substrate-binding protein [Candidatus Thiodiazotropha lotti]MCG8020048.1 phosphate/phosphite/phosphonate ABC transporter substrate-binding protein [Candidatus Thiodiazotropha lotti]MCW4207210.1 phosphate/ph
MQLKSILKSIVRVTFILIQGLSLVNGSERNATILAGISKDTLYDISVADAKIAFALVLNDVLKESGEFVALDVFQNKLEVEKKLLKGDLDAVFTNTLQYLELEEHLNSNGTYIIQHGPNIKPKFYLITKRNAGRDSLDELRGKKISIPKGYAVGNMFLDVLLMRQNHPVSKRFFSEIREASDSNSSLVNLFFGKVDAALVTDFSYEVACELNPQMRKQLTIIQVSEPLIHQVVAVRDDFSQSKLDKIEPYFLNTQRSPNLAQSMSLFRISAIKKLTGNYLTEVRKLRHEFNHLHHRTNSSATH